VETPFGKIEEALGGSAIYFSAAASFFAPVHVVAVVGEDFDLRQLAFLEERGVDFSGLQRQPGKTFRWGGRYDYDLNDRETLFTHLNVFESFHPRIPQNYRNIPYIFLANIDPELQLEVLHQVNRPKLVALDTMNFWIERKPKPLRRVLEFVDVLIINDSEARQLANEYNLIRAMRAIRRMGPQVVIVKKGEHGALMLMIDKYFYAPAYPLEDIFDPTGAGDSFAGGVMGYLAERNSLALDEENLRSAIIFGSTVASFCVEDFSINRLKVISRKDIAERVLRFKELTHFKSPEEVSFRA